MIKTLVFAGSHVQFDFWRRNAKPGNYKYCSKPEDIQGYRGSPIMLIGTYWENDAFKYTIKHRLISNFELL